MKKRETKGASKTEPLNPRCNHNTMSGYGFAVILFNTYLTLHKISSMEIFISTAYGLQSFVPRVCAGPTWSQRAPQAYSSACMDLLKWSWPVFLLLRHGGCNDLVTLMHVSIGQNQESSGEERYAVTRGLTGDLDLVSHCSQLSCMFSLADNFNFSCVSSP